MEVFKLPLVEDQPVAIWARRFFEAAVTRLPIRYANFRADAEYRAAKNMVDDERGCWAIGANIAYAVPGLYWLNYFGEPYADLIGRKRLLTAPAATR